ncbi:MAG: Ribosomal RNA small subunit methyltransferase H [Alphaproteobacteria bacterium MarineAlpha5_Bin5]|nr:MAG: Ribosomal RNA small subunit methyltransferase H [Alphaproteobacteria bacterium MarineAlpha5_Bin5]|tara:strand:+ start:3351 stop:4292 length:942 start_codon:yes stop_codon:yes gene_type:complete
MNNIHTPVMLNEIKSFLPKNKKINLIDATFGGGGYSKAILNEFNVNHLVAIDRDPISNIFAEEIKKRYDNFELINEKFSNIDKVIKKSQYSKTKFDVIIYDLGVSSNQIENSERGFSFQKNGPLDMNMGLSEKTAYSVINSYDENNLAKIIFQLGEEKFSRKIAKNIVKSRKIKLINSTVELANIITRSIPVFLLKKSKIHPATKTFQALRIYVNDEIEELKKALEKSIGLLCKNGLLLIVSFQSLEDRIVKDFFNHNSGKRWRSSRHYPELADTGPVTFEIITKKPLRPLDGEIKLNPRSRSAKLRVAQKVL